MINCHQNTEAADLLGGLRPLRGRERLVTELRKRGQEFIVRCTMACNVESSNAVDNRMFDHLDVTGVMNHVQVSPYIGW